MKTLDRRAAEIFRSMLALQITKIDNSDGTYMPVHIELIGRIDKYDFFSLAHYGQQNGDAMRDPEMLFALHNETQQFILQNLLPNCKVLNINTPKKQKVPKETNWKQKFQKPQNENICLTYLNTEMNGNFHFLSFCAAFLKVQNQVL